MLSANPYRKRKVSMLVMEGIVQNINLGPNTSTVTENLGEGLLLK